MLILIFTEKRSLRLTVDEALSRLQKSAFRAKFHLSDEDINYIDKKGLDTVKSHAEDFIKKTSCTGGYTKRRQANADARSPRV